MNLLKNERLKYILSVFATALMLALTTFGQNDSGKIVGTVTDSVGAFVPNATILIRNEKTGEERTVTSDNQGLFIVTNLRPSFYTIKISNQGFADSEQKNVQLSVGQELNYGVQLQPAGANAVVNVTQSEAAINTASAALSANVNQREVEGLPVNGRQVSQLYLQAPGAVNSGSGTFGDIRFNGRANQQNVIRYDGVEGTAIIDASPGNLNGEVPSPFRLQSSLENIQEFRVDSSNFPAELGTGTGGQISVVTKSGGNQFHGSAFEYLRRSGLDARNFFDNITPGIPKSDLKLDQFGGSIGGPIIKNRLFFFGSYEGYRVRTGLNFIEAAPSLALAQPGALIPGTTTPVSASVQPFIAAFRSPNAVVIPGAATTPGFEIVQLQDTEKTNENAYSARFDLKANDTNSFYFRFFRDNASDNTPEGVTGRRVDIEATPQNGVFGWTSIINSNSLNEFRIGYNGARTRINGFAPTVNGFDFSAATVNISGSVAQSGIAGQGNSSGIAVPGGLVRANSATNGRGQPYTPYSLAFIDSYSWTPSNHNVKFGGELRLVRLYTDRLGGTTYTFSNLAAFLNNTPSRVQYLGDVSAPSPFNDGATGQRLAKQEYYIAYGQDEWKIRPNLTLSYGLRYEYYSPLREDRNLKVLFDIDTGTLRPPSEPSFKSSKTNFGPRVAITYAPYADKTDGFFGGNKTLFRAGFGIYYGPGQTEDQIQPIESDRISSTISSGSLLAFPANIPAIVDNFNNNPNNRQYQPRAYANEYTVPEKIYQYTVSLQQELPYNLVGTVAYVGSQGRNLFLRSVANKILPGQTTILNGTNLPTGVGVINRTDAAGRVIGVTTVREFDIISGTNRFQPFAEVDYKTSGGDDKYNALQLSLARRFNTGLTLNTQYTYQSSFGTTSGSNEARTSAQLDNFEADRGRNTFDVRHTFNLSALYELPIGKNRRYDLGKAANFLVGGLEIGGIVNARSGLPIEVNIVRDDVVAQCANSAGCTFVSNATGGTTTVPQGFTTALPSVSSSVPLPSGFIAVANVPGGGASRNVRRPNIVSGQSFYLNNDRSFINPAAFAAPAPGTFGDLQRNALRGPNFRQLDLVLAKRFRFNERMNIEFRTEVFNIFNITNFASPSSRLNQALPSIAYNATGNFYTIGGGLQPGQAFTQSAAGSTFGLLRSTVERSVGLGTNRQIQFAFRFNF
ncbi:MAG: carboxypeptidase regulatory-like domain-containing protein [Acidobacteriota bacterium]